MDFQFVQDFNFADMDLFAVIFEFVEQIFLLLFDQFVLINKFLFFVLKLLNLLLKLLFFIFLSDLLIQGKVNRVRHEDLAHFFLLLHTFLFVLFLSYLLYLLLLIQDILLTNPLFLNTFLAHLHHFVSIRQSQHKNITVHLRKETLVAVYDHLQQFCELFAGTKWCMLHQVWTILGTSLHS